MKKIMVIIIIICTITSYAASYVKRGNGPISLNKYGHVLIYGWWHRLTPTTGNGPNGEKKDKHSTGLHRAEVAKWKDTSYNTTKPKSSVQVKVTAYEGN